MKKSLIDRFHEKYQVVPSGCWMWTGATMSKGYGKVMITTAPKTTYLEGAHRLSWLLHNGPIPEGKQVLHKCDVRSCVNPEHLFVGTNQDNIQDRIAKGNPNGVPGRKRLTVRT